MEIISHRGYWKEAGEKNQPVAFERSFQLGFGTETDIRDREGRLVISHDMADASSISLDSFLELYKKHNLTTSLALNIKADGLQIELFKKLEEYGVTGYFVFDMSIPDALGYARNGIRFFSRQSEYEPTPALYEQCAGIWLDAFHDDWYGAELIQQHVIQGKQVAIVSPDLHKREYLPFWEKLKTQRVHQMEEVILCTDFPEEAQQFFGN